MNTIEGYRHIDPTKCGEFEYRTWTQNAILELDERLRAIEEWQKAFVNPPVKYGAMLNDQPDPLAPWKALRAGDKVLYIPSKTVWTIKDRINDEELIADCEDQEGAILVPGQHAYFSKHWQILQTGPFNPRILKYDEWFYNEKIGWTKFKGISPSDGFIAHESNGTIKYFHPGNTELHFAPPDPQPSALEVARNKIIRIQKHPQCTHAEYEAELTAILTEFKEAGR